MCELEVRGGEAEGLEGSGPERVDENVDVRKEGLEEGESTRGFQVEGDGGFVPREWVEGWRG